MWNHLWFVKRCQFCMFITTICAGLSCFIFGETHRQTVTSIIVWPRPLWGLARRSSNGWKKFHFLNIVNYDNQQEDSLFMSLVYVFNLRCGRSLFFLQLVRFVWLVCTYLRTYALCTHMHTRNTLTSLCLLFLVVFNHTTHTRSNITFSLSNRGKKHKLQ